jgi:beta-phosphoglucomutase-like phosphatase (HAD superfamily)
VRSAARRKYHGNSDAIVFPLKQGVLELLIALRAQGVQSAVASSSTSSEIEERLAIAGVLHFFKATAGGNEV